MISILWAYLVVHLLLLLLLLLLLIIIVIRLLHATIQLNHLWLELLCQLLVLWEGSDRVAHRRVKQQLCCCGLFHRLGYWLILYYWLNLLCFLRLRNRGLEHLHERGLRYFAARLVRAVWFTDVGLCLGSIIIILPGNVDLIWDHWQLNHSFIMLILRKHNLTVPLWRRSRYNLLPLIFTFIIMLLLLWLDQVVLLRRARLRRLLGVLTVWLDDAGYDNHRRILLCFLFLDGWGTRLLLI